MIPFFWLRGQHPHKVFTVKTNVLCWVVKPFCNAFRLVIVCLSYNVTAAGSRAPQDQSCLYLTLAYIDAFSASSWRFCVKKSALVVKTSIEVSKLDSAVVKDSLKVTFSLLARKVSGSFLPRAVLLAEAFEPNLVSFHVVVVEVGQRLLQQCLSCVVDLLD